MPNQCERVSARFANRDVVALFFIALPIAVLPSVSAQDALRFEESATVAVEDTPTDLATGDFNRDGNPDLAVLNRTSESVSILLGDGLGGLTAGPNLSVISGPRAVLVADFNRNGTDDILVINETSQNVVIRLGLSNGTFGAANAFATGVSGFSGVEGDFNEDGVLDVVVVGLNGGVRFLAGNGDGTFDAATTVTVANGRRHLVAADLNRDGILDLAMPGFVGLAPQVAVVIGNGDGSFGAATNFSSSSQALALAAVDLNRDGKLDLAVATSEINRMTLLIGDGNGSFGAPTTPFTTQTDHVKVADFDRDGIQDLLLINNINDRIDVKRGAGDGTLVAATTRTEVINPIDFAIADFNRDGKPDYAVCTSDGTTADDAVVVLLNKQGEKEPTGIPVNVSTRALATSTSAVIPGFVVSGAPMRVLVRAVGPGLAQFGVTNFLANPKLTIFSETASLFSNDDWSAAAENQASVTTASAEVGAFPLTVGSADAAIVVTLEPGAYTIVGDGEAGSTGEVLVEIYKADL